MAIGARPQGFQFALLVAAERTRVAAESRAGIPAIRMIDRTSWEMLQRLVDSGMLQFASRPTCILHRAHADAALQLSEPAARAA